MFNRFKDHHFINNVLVVMNASCLIMIILISLTALIIQFFYNSLPCPLCLFQRAGLLGIGLGYLLNLKSSNRILHYFLSILMTLITGVFAGEQILLHIGNGTAYGIGLLGLHLYTWMFIICIIFLIINIIMLCITAYLKGIERTASTIYRSSYTFFNFLIMLYLLIIATNFILSMLECGINKYCPSDPSQYILLLKLETIIKHLI